MQTDETMTPLMEQGLKALHDGNYREAVASLSSLVSEADDLTEVAPLIDAVIAELLTEIPFAQQRRLLAPLLEAPDVFDLMIATAIGREMLEPALKWCDQLIARYPDNPLAYMKRSSIRMVLGDRKVSEEAWDEADALYRRSLADINSLIQTMPDQPWIYVQRARLWIRLGEEEAALSDYARALEADPAAVEVRLERGWLLQGFDMPEEARDDFNTYLASHPDDGLAHYGLGLAHLTLEEVEPALQSFCTAIELDPSFASTYIGRAEAYELLDDFDRAMADYNRALELAPDRIDVYLYRGRLQTIIGEYNDSIDETAVADRAYQDALSDYTALISLDPDASSGYRARADLLWQLEEPEKALADYDRAMELEPDSAELYIERGRVRRALHQYAEALADYNAAIQLEPESPWGYFHRGETLQLQGDYAAALKDYATTLELDPEFYETHRKRAVIYGEQGDDAEALREYDAALRIFPQDCTTRLDRAAFEMVIAEKRERADLRAEAEALYKAAIEDYTEVLEIRLDLIEALYSRGYAAERLSDYGAALADYSRVLELDADHAGAYVRRGRVYAALGDTPSALESYGQALRLDPTHPEALAGRADLCLSRGGALIGEGRAEEAGQAMRQAIADYTLMMEQAPRRPELYTSRGRALEYLGDFEAAQADYAQALTLGSDGVAGNDRDSEDVSSASGDA